MNKKVLFVVNTASFFISHRLPIALKLKQLGYDVHIIAPEKTSVSFLQQQFTYHTIDLSRQGKNPLKEFLTIYQLYQLFRKINPTVIHLITIKPCLYGGIVARMTKTPAVISALSGLGFIFTSNDLKIKLLRRLLYLIYRLALNHPNQLTIFQNQADKQLMLNWGVVKPDKIRLIYGSGVDLEEYKMTPEPNYTDKKIIVTFAARLLLDKGICEFINASKKIAKQNTLVEFWVVGDIDIGNPNTLNQSEVSSWKKYQHIKVLGFQKNIAKIYSESHIVCMPSYYGEGLPKSLIEAAACGRPVVTTDSPGCRDAIIHERTGILVPVKDTQALSKALIKLINNKELRIQMGQEGRKLAEQKFSIHNVIEKHIEIYDYLMNKGKIKE